MPLNVGTRLGHYDVIAKIGEGGMGEVCQARDTALNKGAAGRASACAAHGCDFSRGILPFTMRGAVVPRVA